MYCGQCFFSSVCHANWRILLPMTGILLGIETIEQAIFSGSAGGRSSPCAEGMHLDMVLKATLRSEHCVRLCSLVSNSPSSGHHTSCGFPFFFGAPPLGVGAQSLPDKV